MLVHFSYRICAVSLHPPVWQSLKNSIHPQPGGLTSFQSLCPVLRRAWVAATWLALRWLLPRWTRCRLLDVGCRVYRHGDPFAECSLAQLYKERDVNGQFVADRHGIWRAGWGCAGWAFCRPLFAHRLRHNFQRSSGERLARALSFSFDFPPLVTGIILLSLLCWQSLAVFMASPGSCRVCPVDGDNLGTDQPGNLRNDIGQLPHVIWSIFESAFGWQKRQAARRDIP